MLINKILSFSQNLLKNIYANSYILKNIDKLIGLNIYFVIIFSTFAQSDYIGYFAIFAIFLTAIKYLTKSNIKINLSTSGKSLLIYFLLVLISVAGSSLFYLSLKGFFKTLTYLGFYLSLLSYLKDNKEQIKYIFIAIATCAFSESIFAFLQNFTSVDEISGWQDTSRLNPEEVMTRVYGTLKPYNPNLFGGYMLAIIPSFITLPFINKKMFFPSIIGICTSILALFFTGCRGAYIGLFFEILLTIAFCYKFIKPQLKKILTTFISFGTLISSLIIISLSSLRARIFSIFAMRNDSSNSFRFNVYHSCINMFKDNWLLGIGVGNQNFREIYGLYMKTGFDALSAYNIYLETAVESGILALIAFLIFIGITIYKGLKTALKALTKENIYILAAIISLIGLLLHGFVDTVFFRPQIQFIFWIMIAIITVNSENNK